MGWMQKQSTLISGFLPLRESEGQESPALNGSKSQAFASEQVEEEGRKHPSLSFTGIAQTNILSTNSTHGNSGVLKFYAPDVFRIIAVPREAVSALAQAASSLRSPRALLSHGGWCKGKRSQMARQSYFVNLLCYNEYPWVWSSLELCSKRRKRGHIKCFVILSSLGAKIAISG